MERFHIGFLSVVGVITLAIGILVATTAGAEAPASLPLQETPPEGAVYVGSDTCFQCHSSNYRDWQDTIHPRMIQDPVADPSAVLADFAVGGEDVRMAEFGGETRPYTIDDVVFTMGTKFRQRFIAETEDGGFTVLPGQWNIAAEEWVEASPGNWLTGCAGCHTTGFDVETQTWSETGVACEACHGPGSVHVEFAELIEPGADDAQIREVRGAIVNSVDAAICGSCHTRGTSPDGEHGYPIGYTVGGPLDESMFLPVAATGEADDPNFWPDGSERKHRQQYIAWLDSAHGNALETITSADFARESCLACHSTDFIMQDDTFAEDVVNLENAQFSITCVQCHDPHAETLTPGMLRDESYDLCVSCHTGTGEGRNPIRVGGTVHHPMREMFEGISFLGLDPNPSAHFANEAFGPICASCHMVGTAKSAEVGDIPTHTWQVILPAEAAEGQPDSCTGCHTLERNPDNTPENLTFVIEDVQADTTERLEDLRADLDLVNEENPDWDPNAESKSDEQLMAERIHTLLSFVEADGSLGFHNPEYTDDILSEAEDLMDDLLDALDL